MKLYIKNMVCNRCITAVERVFKDLNLEITAVALGELETADELDSAQLRKLDESLRESGFEILEDSAQQLIEKVKNEIILLVDGLDIPEDFILSKFISEKLHRDYSAVSKLFSQNENVTLEHYFILQKIEKVKELLLYDEFSLTEISGQLGYKSVQHFSRIFKEYYNYTPMEYRQRRNMQ